MISFVVYGRQIPQGSAKAIRAKGQQRAFVVPSNERELRSWRADIASAAADAMAGQPPIAGRPVQVIIEFMLLRPSGHLRTDGTPRPGAPRSVAKRPDIDKLCRAVLDGITGVVIHDDGQVSTLRAVKMYADKTVATYVAVVEEET